MRFEYTRETSDFIGGIESTTTESLVVELPDPVVNINVKPVLNVVETTPGAAAFSKEQVSRAKSFIDGNRRTPSPVQTARTALEGKDPFHNPKPGDRQCTPTTGERAFAKGGIFDPPEDVGPPVHFDCHQPGENVAAFREVFPEFFNEVHFKATPGERFAGVERFDDIPLRYAAMEPRRPNREIPLWAFARQFFVNEFTVLDPRRADAIADHFMEQYKAKWKDGKESGR